MKKPLGVILAVLVLGLCAAILLLASAGMAFAAASIASHGLPVPAQPAGPPQLSAHASVILCSACALFFLALTAAAIVILVGVVNLRNWARYAILTVGGLLAFFGISSLGVLLFLPSALSASQPQGTPVTPGMMQDVLLVIELIYGAVAAVGAWWLVYFNLSSVKAYFLPGYREPALDPPALPRPSAASLATPGGLPAEAYPYPASYAPSYPGRLAHIPTSIIVIAILFFLATLSCGIIALLPFPAYLCGFIFTGPVAPRLLYITYAAGALFIGIKLLQLSNIGRLGVYIFSGIGFLSLLVTVTPWGYARYAVYNTLLQAHLHTGGQDLALQAHMQHALLLLSLLVATVLYGLQIWLIERHRTLFT